MKVIEQYIVYVDKGNDNWLALLLVLCDNGNWYLQDDGEFVNIPDWEGRELSNTNN